MSNTIEFYDSVSVAVNEEVDSCSPSREMERRGLWIALAGSAVIGAWAIICLVGGLCSCESFSMIKSSLFMALTGM